MRSRFLRNEPLVFRRHTRRRPTTVTRVNVLPCVAKCVFIRSARRSRRPLIRNTSLGYCFPNESSHGFKINSLEHFVRCTFFQSIGGFGFVDFCSFPMASMNATISGADLSRRESRVDSSQMSSRR